MVAGGPVGGPGVAGATGGGGGGLDRPLSDVRFLTVAEVAALMRVSKMTVYRLVHGGGLPAVRVGRSFRVPEQAVHEYLRDAYYDVG
jgi:excisionase family DNA binding protein